MTPPGAPSPRGALRRALDALLWAVLAAVGAPVAFSIGVTLVTAVREPGVPSLGVMFYFLSFSLFATVAFALAPYAALLVAWAFAAARLRRAERSHASLVVLTAVLALPAGIVMATSVSRSWLDALAAFAILWLAAWIGLLLPRLVVPRLAPGAFARDHAPLRPEPSDA